MRDPRSVALLLDIQYRAELFVTIPAGALTAVFGSLLVGDGGFSFGEAWVVAAFVLLGVALVIDLGVLVRRNRRLRGQACASIERGMLSDDALRRAASAPAVVATGALLDAVFVAFLFLMVVKPGV